jgi:hypothetical protein
MFQERARVLGAVVLAQGVDWLWLPGGRLLAISVLLSKCLEIILRCFPVNELQPQRAHGESRRGNAVGAGVSTDIAQRVRGQEPDRCCGHQDFLGQLVLMVLNQVIGLLAEVHRHELAACHAHREDVGVLSRAAV